MKIKTAFLVKGYHKMFIAKAKRFDTLKAAQAYKQWMERQDFYEISIEAE